jgi:transposase
VRRQKIGLAPVYTDVTPMMVRGYSNDLRVRVIQVVESGVAARAAARQFVIGDSTAIRWAKRWRETGSVEARSNKGQSRSPLKHHEQW